MVVAVMPVQAVMVLAPIVIGRGICSQAGSVANVMVPVPLEPVPPVAVMLAVCAPTDRAIPGMPAGGTHEPSSAIGVAAVIVGSWVMSSARSDNRMRRLALREIALQEYRLVGDVLVGADPGPANEVDRGGALRHQRQVEPLRTGHRVPDVGAVFHLGQVLPALDGVAAGP
jgi:hypothetical protein